MYVDPKNPLPIVTEKKDGLGELLNAIIEVNNVRVNKTGTPEQSIKKVQDVEAEANRKLDKFDADADAALKAHTDKRGAIHGESKFTVGLENKDNWPMATMDGHETGPTSTTYAHPRGLKHLVQSRLVIDPRNYIGSRIIPIASGGLLGNVPQFPFSWSTGERVQSFADPMEYYTETPWQFSTDSGITVMPSLNGADVLTDHVAQAGERKYASTPWGGTSVRIYNRSVDIRRTRPSMMASESETEPNSELIKGSAHLFDRHSIYVLDGTEVGLRSFNKSRLPFDILTNKSKWQNNWSGILESRENIIYNINAELVRGNIGGFGDDIYLKVEMDMYTFLHNGMDAKNGPGLAAETTAEIDQVFTSLAYTVPASGKYRVYDRPGKPQGICIKLSDILHYTPAQLDGLWNKVNGLHSRHIAFTWRNRLKGDFAIRIPVGFYSNDKSHYTNYYIDMSYLVKDDLVNKTATVNLTSLRDIEAKIQTLNDNFQVSEPGRFVEYAGTVINDPFHPLAFNGIFESVGGHVKTYTLYNRQYVGYYQHNVNSVKTWIANGDDIKPVLTKYSYNQMSNLNNDGMYGDHLRHIPVGIGGGKIDYLTLTRDWRQNYRWAITNVDQDTAGIMTSESGHFYGPWRNKVTWINPLNGKVPSFVIANSEEDAVFDTNCLVFNTQNEFSGYGRFGYDLNSAEEPLVWLDPVGIDDSILSWIAINGGGWGKNLKQMFYFKGSLFWFSQTTSPDEIKPDGTDCYYGYIKDIYIDVAGEVRTVKCRTDLGTAAVALPLKVNTAKSLSVVHKEVVGLDTFSATDVYLMHMGKTGAVDNYQVMVNLGPFNNFYFEFVADIDVTANTTTFGPKTDAIDPIFKFDAATGFSVDYDTVTAYGTKTPHRFHVNYQSPVMLKKSMWSFRRTPGSYGLFSASLKTTVVIDGVMNSVAGTPIYPVGSVITVGGACIPVKQPVTAKDSDYPTGRAELFVTMSGTSPVLYSKENNPLGLEDEPNSGVVPCGFLKNKIFYHNDPDGWRNSLLPVVDGKRMNFFGYGSSFPAFLGVHGSGLPINRFFINNVPSIVVYDTGSGRVIPTIGNKVRVMINGDDYPLNGATTFTIPDKYTGNVEVHIINASTIKWSKGLFEVKKFAPSVTKLDFSNSEIFKFSAPLTSSITSLANVFQNALGSYYEGLSDLDISGVNDISNIFNGAAIFNQVLNWNTANVTNISGAFSGAVAYNQPLNWNTANVTNMAGVFNGATVFNQVLNWNTGKVINMSAIFMNAKAYNNQMFGWKVNNVVDMSDMFNGADSFNIDLSTWAVHGARTMARMFMNAKTYNRVMLDWDVTRVLDMSDMFNGAVAFKQAINRWRPRSVTTIKGMFANTKSYVGGLALWPMGNCTDMSFAFANSVLATGTVAEWDTSNVTTMEGMFQNAVNFNQDLSVWNVAKVTNHNNFDTNTPAWVLPRPNFVV